MAARALAPGKGHLNQSWGYEHPSNTPSDFGRVCDWAEMTAGQMLPECRRATCKGHNPDDRVPGLEEFTNQQFYDFADPREAQYRGCRPYDATTGRTATRRTTG